MKLGPSWIVISSLLLLIYKYQLHNSKKYWRNIISSIGVEIQTRLFRLKLDRIANKNPGYQTIFISLDMQVQDISNLEIADEKSRQTRPPSSVPIDLDTINELQLMVNTSDTQDLQELTRVLDQLLDYPKNKIVELHKEAMRLGNFDLQDQYKKQGKARLDTSSQMLEFSQKKQYCPCCGFIKQQENIKMCTSLDGIKNMGLSTYLFFATFKNLSILLLIMILVYGIFAQVTNLIAAGYIFSNTGKLINEPIVAISLSPKELIDNDNNRLYYYISCWTGVAMVLTQIIALVGIKYKEVKDSQEYDSDTISCSDYTIVVEGLPMDVRKQDLQKQLDNYYQTSIKNNSRLPAVWKQPLTIAKLNIGKPFYLSAQALQDQETEQIDKDLEELKQKLVDIIQERRDSRNFTIPKEQREKMYSQYEELKIRKIQKCTQMQAKIRETLRKEEDHSATTVFITFQTNNAKTVMSFIHDTGILNKLRSLCSDEHRRFSFSQEGSEISLEIKRAPEPQDILWYNIGHADCAVYCRKFFTYVVTTMLLGLSFGIVFGLTKLQQSANDSPIISIAISATIGIINPILGVVIKFLTAFEKDYTMTNREASLAIKSIIAQMINSIVIPVVTAYEIKEDVYSTSGLVNNVFMLGITTALVPPLVLIVDPYNLFMKLMRCIKSRSSSKLWQTQKQHNLIHEGIQFQIGFHYIYLANSFMFVCFFISLQPIVSVFALLGFFLMFWVQKYCVLYRYRRPVPGTDFVNNAVWRIFFLGPLVYSFGSMTWSNLAPGGIPPEAIIPNLVALGLSFLLFLAPINTIILGSCFSDNYEKVKKYHDERVLFPSQYDRLNPSTQEEGILEYKSFMEKKMEELKHSSKEKQAEFAQLMAHNAQRAQMNQKAMTPSMGGALTSIFGAPQQPLYMPQQQFNPMASFMPIIPGFQPGFQAPLAQALVIKGGKTTSVPMSPYPQYHNQARPAFNNQVHMSPQRTSLSTPVQVINMGNPMGMVNAAQRGNPISAMMGAQNQMGMGNPLNAFGFGGNNNQRRRF